MVPGVKWSDGPAIIQVVNSSGRSAEFKPMLFDDSYRTLIAHLLTGLASEASALNEEMQLAEEYDVADEHGSWDMVQGALRYFPTVTDLDEVRTLECVMVGNENSWAGLAILSKKDFGFFEYDECLVEDTDAGSPVLFKLKDLSGCKVVKPEDFTLNAGGHVSLTSAPQTNLIIKLELKNESFVRLGVPTDAYTQGEKQHVERLVHSFLRRIEGKLAKKAAL